MKKPRGIVRNSNSAVVISIPQRFDLTEELGNAHTILLATAFARRSGWAHLKRGIYSGKADVSLLTGLDFQQTEPELLRDWLSLGKKHGRIKAKVATRDSIFHPKVLVVLTAPPRRSFAIVGSGNLTNGGIRTNTECSMYSGDSTELADLTSWFQERWKEATKLEPEALAEYEPKYKKARRALQQIRKEQRLIQKAVAKIADRKESNRRAVLHRLDSARSKFEEYQRTQEFNVEDRKRREAATRLRRLLHVPDFDFTHEEFTQFYKARELGGLMAIFLPGILKHDKRLRQGLRHLVDESEPVEERVDSLLAKRGRYHIRGFNKAAVSKVLTVSYPEKWPVLNGAVETALRKFEYDAPRGSPGEKYRMFVEIAKKFRAKDFIALDVFLKKTQSDVKRAKHAQA